MGAPIVRAVAGPEAASAIARDTATWPRRRGKGLAKASMRATSAGEEPPVRTWSDRRASEPGCARGALGSPRADTITPAIVPSKRRAEGASAAGRSRPTRPACRDNRWAKATCRADGRATQELVGSAGCGQSRSKARTSDATMCSGRRGWPWARGPTPGGIEHRRAACARTSPGWRGTRSRCAATSPGTGSGAYEARSSSFSCDEAAVCRAVAEGDRARAPRGTTRRAGGAGEERPRHLSRRSRDIAVSKRKLAELRRLQILARPAVSSAPASRTSVSRVRPRPQRVCNSSSSRREFSGARAACSRCCPGRTTMAPAWAEARRSSGKRPKAWRRITASSCRPS